MPSFAGKLQELAAEQESEVKLRRFAKQVSNSSLNLHAELRKFDQQRYGALDMSQFKRAMQSLTIAVNEEDIKPLFQEGVMPQSKGQSLDMKYFVEKVNVAAKSKPQPSFLSDASKTADKTQSRIGRGIGKPQTAQSTSGG